MRWACVLGLLLALLNLSTSLLLGAWNIQIFGKTKVSKSAVMNDICRIVCRYHIILIQEVRDSKLRVTNALKEAVNSRCPRYDYIASEPLGRSKSYKERYLFFYRVGMVSMVRSYIYKDPHGFYNVFSRPPFIVEFFSEYTVVENFVLIPQHTTPKKAVEQINALYDVVTHVKTKWKNNNIVLLGDFNAGGGYVPAPKKPKKPKLNFSKDSTGFNWLIKDNHATSVKTGYPYDRIVVTDDMMKKGVVPDSAKVYNFMLEFNLNLDKASDISDHFPVEVTLKEVATSTRKRKWEPE